MDSQHQRGLLIHMGKDTSGMNYKQVERAIMQTWADQVCDRVCNSTPQCRSACCATQTHSFMLPGALVYSINMS